MLAHRVRMVGPVRMVRLYTLVNVCMVMSAPTVKQVYKTSRTRRSITDIPTYICISIR